MTTYTEGDKAEITALLLGRSLTKVSDDTLVLDNGRVLKFAGNEGGCSCGAGDYDLTALNGVDNIITNVTFEDAPNGDDYDAQGYEGSYRIFVFADNKAVNLATFTGTDGNGCYGTGYSIEVREAD